MERVLIKNISKFEGKKALVKGRVFNIRNLGNIVFLVVSDYTGTLQTVVDKSVHAKTGDAVAIRGTVKKDERAKGGFEMKGEEVEVVSSNAEDLPFDLAKEDLNLNLATLLDYRPLSLRHPRVQAIFRLYDILLKSYETVMRNADFIEIKTPKLLGSATEGGANFFKVKYFEKEATLAQSPQLYKQIMVGVFERVFEIGSVFRAEPHFTTRHVNEYVGLDAEMGFIRDFSDVTRELNGVLVKMFKIVEEEGREYLDSYGVKELKVPEEIPSVRLSEIKRIIKERYDYEVPEDTDIDPKGEELAGRYAKEEFDSDFIFITHYPWDERPFYTMVNPENEKETCGFDLLYKGLEIATGGQRIHEYDELVKNMKRKKVKTAGLEFYLNVFKFAVPPHGGWGMGSERIIKQMLGLENIKEAILFPRDVKRLTP